MAGSFALPRTTGTVHVFCHVPASVEGAGLKLVGTQAAPRRGAAPLALRAGMLTWHLPDGSLLPELLATHRHLAEGPTKGMRARSGSGKWPQLLAEAGAAAETAAAAMAREERLAAACQQALALCHFEQALAAARELGDPALLREVALAALQFLDLPAAVAAYEAAGDKAALAQLHPLLGEGDAGLVTGRVTALAGGACIFEQLRKGGGLKECLLEEVGCVCCTCICDLLSIPNWAVTCRRCRPRRGAAAGELQARRRH